MSVMAERYSVSEVFALKHLIEHEVFPLPVSDRHAIRVAARQACTEAAKAGESFDSLKTRVPSIVGAIVNTK